MNVTELITGIELPHKINIYILCIKYLSIYNSYVSYRIVFFITMYVYVRI